ncbi:MAG TPA: septal ring lytic transglycosylase RlpA family protein [Stellaceae bacterium]|nr:septal ring lytic transglycosylase RlpA family protein [Stellaceae bacterium]
MKLRVTYGVAVVSLALACGALSSRSLANELPQLNPPPAEAPDIGSPVHIAAVTNAVAQLASAAVIGVPRAAEATSPDPSPPPAPKPIAPVQAEKRHPASHQIATLAGSVAHPDRSRVATASDSDARLIKVKAIGPCQIGTAAWYGGRYIGRRTSSGEPLDQIHATAAHRTLPLNSLVRVTNLNNGRSVVVRITDRGPVSQRLLIDMSPKAADELAMKTAGIVPVSIEQVVEVADASK